MLACHRAPNFATLRLTSENGIYMYIQPKRLTMARARSRTFRSGNSEALRLPKDVAFGNDVELVLIRSGDVLTIYPATLTIPHMVARLQSLPSPSAIEARDTDELPERHGL